MLLFKGPTEQQNLAEGEIWSDGFKFVNISGKHFADSLSVSVEVVNQTSAQKETQAFKIKPPIPSDSTVFNVSVNTHHKAGLNNVSVSVNRKILPEQYYENNTVDMPGYLNVKADDIPPVLEVSVDGRFIVNGDYVSSNPQILATMRDENPYLFKADTLGMNIFLSYPCPDDECPFERINFSGDDVQWLPASASADFQIKYNPRNLPDGKYTLRVEAEDATGNASGPEPYEVNFMVDQEAALELKEVFPNPSSSDFFFRFLLKGNELPDDFSLRIYALDGRLMQQYALDDIRHFYVGTNEVQWQARDNSGNVLPGGMYIYRLRISTKELGATQNGKLIISR